MWQPWIILASSWSITTKHADRRFKRNEDRELDTLVTNHKSISRLRYSHTGVAKAASTSRPTLWFRESEVAALRRVLLCIPSNFPPWNWWLNDRVNASVESQLAG